MVKGRINSVLLRDFAALLCCWCRTIKRACNWRSVVLYKYVYSAPRKFDCMTPMTPFEALLLLVSRS